MLIINFGNVVVLDNTGTITRILGPGFYITKRFETIYAIVDMRRQEKELSLVDVFTKDYIPLEINATVFYRVRSDSYQLCSRAIYRYSEEDIRKAVLNVVDWKEATEIAAESVLRDVIASYRLDDILDPLDRLSQRGTSSPRDVLQKQFQDRLNDQTKEWGVVITEVRIGTIDVPDEVKAWMLTRWKKEGEELQEFQREPGGNKHMDWNTIISLAVSAVSPYATAFALSTATAAGIKLGEAASESIKGLWQWIHQTVFESDDESAKQVWQNFTEDPQSNKDALVDVILRLSPHEDTALRGFVQGVIQEVERREAAQFYTLLEASFTLNDVRKVASRVNPQWEDELGSDPNKVKLATWVINYTYKRKQLTDLIAAMLEVNPTVMLQ
jgi:hypothetical protein